MTWLWVSVGAAAGAAARYLVARGVRSRHGGLFPWATFSVNVVGSLILGLVTGASSAVPSGLGLAVGTGFCGALTTYSTFGYETLQLAGDGDRLLAVLNVVGSIAAGMAAAAAGYALGAAL